MHCRGEKYFAPSIAELKNNEQQPRDTSPPVNPAAGMITRRRVFIL